MFRFGLLLAGIAAANAQPDESQFFQVPVEGWAYENCAPIRYEGDDAFARGSEDIRHFRDDFYLVSTGLYGSNPPTNATAVVSRTDQDYRLGGIYILDISTTPPGLYRAMIHDLPPSLNWRPHGIFIDQDNSRLFVVSHNDQLIEENIVILTIEDDNSISGPSFRFQVALYSSQWVPVGGHREAFHLNDVVYAGNNEILATKYGPTFQEPPSPKRLWSCSIQESYEDVPEDGRVETTCTQALTFPPNATGPVGLNGITISDDKQTVWAADSSFAQLLQIAKDTTGSWILQDTIPVLAYVDNLEYMDGTLHMGCPLKVDGALNGTFLGSYLVGTKQPAAENYEVKVAFQFSPSFLEELGEFFGVSSALPVANGQYLVLGSWDFPGIVLCKAAASTDLELEPDLPADVAVMHFTMNWLPMVAALIFVNRAL